MRKINTKFFVSLVVLVALLTAAVFGVHRLQAGNIAEALLWQAHQAEKDGKFDRAAKYLGRYLEFAREDLDEREHLALILSDPQVATTPQRRARARFVIEQVLAKDPNRHALRERLCQNLITGRLFEAAKEHLNYLQKNQPSSAEGAYLLGLWHEGQNQPTQAIDAYRRAIKTDAGKVEAYLRLTAVLKQADFGKEPRHAREIDQLVTAILEKAPNNASALSLAAQHAQEKGNHGIALKFLEDGLKQNPREPRLYLALARVHGQGGKRGEAIDILQAGLQKVGKEHHYDLRWNLANLQLDDNRLDDALPVIAALREVNPVTANFLEARTEMHRGRWFEAARQFEKVRPAMKSMKELAFQLDMYLGTCYEQLDEPSMQLTAMQRAADADPTSLAAQRGLANARWALGQTGEALRIYQDLVTRTKEPDAAAQRRVEYVRLLLQSRQKRTQAEWKKIDQELDEIEKTLVKSLDVALLRAELRFLQGERKNAEAVLHESIKDHPDRHEPWLALISVAAEQKDTATVQQLMQTAEARFKNNAAFRVAQARFWSRYYDDDAAAGLKRIESDMAKFTPRDQSGLLQAMAEAHYWAQKYDDSARVLERMLQMPLHAQDVRVRMQMLEIAVLQGDDAKAQTMLAQIKKIEGDGGVEGSFGEAFRIIRLHPHKTKDLDKARHLLTVAAAQRPNWHPIIQARAELDELQGRPDQAIANYRQAVDLGSRDPQATRQLLMLLSQAQRFDEVEQLLARMQKQLGTTEEIVRYYVQLSSNRHDYRRTELLVKQVIAANSTNYRDHLWKGQILSTTGRSPEEAEKSLRRAVELAPRQPETWINLVRHLISAGQPQAAQTEIVNAGKALPADRSDLAVAQCCELLGSLNNAGDFYRAAVEKLPNSAIAHRAAADFHLRINNFARAEVLYRKIAARQIPAAEEDITAARRGLALALVKQERPQKSTEALQLVGLTLDDNGNLPEGRISDSYDEQLIQAKILGSLNHHKLRGKAIGVLEALHQKNALQADDQFFLARLLAIQGADAASWTKTRDLLRALTNQYPKNARYLAYAAQQNIQQKDYTEAEAILTRLESVERERKTLPGGFGSIELRSKILEMRGLGAQAATLLKDYVEQPGASPIRKMLLANLQGRLANFRDAVDIWESVLKEAPGYLKDNADAAGLIAAEANASIVGILRANKPSEALPTKYNEWREQRRRVEAGLRDSFTRNPKDVSSRLHLADLMELQGQYGEVEKLCWDVLKADESNIVALNNLAWLLGQKADTAAEGLKLIEKAIEQYGPRPELVDTRAIVHLNLGNTDKALRDMQRVVNEAPTPTRLFHLCRTHEKTRNATTALAMLRQANEQGLTLQQLHPAEQAEYQRVTAELGKQQ